MLREWLTTGLLTLVFVFAAGATAGCNSASNDYDGSLKEGQRLVKAGKYRDALVQLDKAVGLRQDSTDAHFYRAICNLYLARSPKAFEDFDAIEALSPGSKSGLQARALNLARGVGQYDKALELANQAIKLDPNDCWSYFIAANVANDGSQWQRSLDSINKALALCPDIDCFIELKGATLARMNKTDEAEACFRQMLSRDENDVRALNSLGDLYLNSRKDAKKAEEMYRKALQADPKFIWSRIGLSASLQQQNRKDECLKLWQSPPAVLLKDPGFFLYRGAALVRLGKDKEAVEDLNTFFKKSQSKRFTKEELAYGYCTRETARIKLGQYDGAIEDLKAALALLPDNLELQIELADLYVVAGRVQSGATETERLLAMKNLSNKQYGRLHMLRGKLFTFKKDQRKALAQYDEAIKLNPEDGRAYEARGLCLNELGKKQAALADLNKARKLGIDTLILDTTIAALYAKQGKGAKAHKELMDASAKHPTDPDFYLQRAAYCANSGATQDAKEAIKMLRKMAPLNAKQDWWLGDIYNKMGMRQDALRHHLKSIGEDATMNSRVKARIVTNSYARPLVLDTVSNMVTKRNEDPAAYYLKGLFLHSANDFDGALACFNESIKLAPRVGRYYGARAFIYMDRGDFEQSLADFNRAIDQYEMEDPLLYIGRGMARCNDGQFKNAISDYTSAIDLQPKQEFAPYLERGICYETVGELPKAQRDFETALQYEKPKRSNVLKRLAKLYQRQGNLDKSLQTFNQALAVSPNDYLLVEGRADIYGQLKKYPEALAGYEAVLKLNPNDTGAYYKRADILKKLGKNDQARRELTRAHKMDRDMLGPDRKRVRRRSVK